MTVDTVEPISDDERKKIRARRTPERFWLLGNKGGPDQVNLHKVVDSYEARLTASEAENKRLREALEPLEKKARYLAKLVAPRVIVGNGEHLTEAEHAALDVNRHLDARAALPGGK